MGVVLLKDGLKEAKKFNLGCPEEGFQQGGVSCPLQQVLYVWRC